MLGMSKERRLCHFTWAFGRLSPPTGAVDPFSFWNCLIWLKKETFEFNSWNFKPAGSTNRGTVRTLYQSLICLKTISQLPLGIWEAGSCGRLSGRLPPARLALIKNSFDEQECPSRCWLISKPDRPIDVKREEQQELENFSYPIEMFVTLTVTLLPFVVLGGHHGSGVWKLWI